MSRDGASAGSKVRLFQSLLVRGKKEEATLSHYSLVQVINEPTYRCGHIINWVIVRPDDDIHKKYTIANSLESDHYCTISYFNTCRESTNRCQTMQFNVACSFNFGDMCIHRNMTV